MATTVTSSWSKASKSYSTRHYRAWLTYAVSTTNTAVTVTAYSGVELDLSISADIIGSQSMTGYSAKSGTAVMAYAQSNPTLKKTTVSTQTYTFSRTTSAQTKTLSATAKSTESGFQGDTVTVSVTITVPALPKYTITYNANGGSGAPAAQSKWHGTNITLSSAKPTKSGYTFVGWNTSSSATASQYAAGATYSSNASVTLYAIWKKTITVTYNANGGSGAPASQSATVYNGTTSSSFTLSGTRPTKTNYEFLGWSTSSSAATASYQPGTACTFSSNTTLYAVWKPAYLKPTIDNLTCYRVDQNDEVKDDGTYLHLYFDYVGGSIDGGVNHFTPGCKMSIDDGNPSVITLSSGSGYYSAMLSGTYSADTTFKVTIQLYDADYDTTGTTATIEVSTATYPIDIVGSGTNVYMGVMTPAVGGQKLTVPELFNIGMIGSVQLYAGSSAPNGWLFCDGSAVSRTVYEELFDVIGTTYGTGDGSTTFNLPDLKGRVPIGAGTGSASTSTNHALGSSGGQETHTLTPAQTALKSHTHKVTLGSHRHYPYSGSSYKFVQTTSGQTVNAGGISGSGTRVYVAAATSATTNWQSQTGSTDLGEKTTGGVTEANGSAHNNMQPYLTMNYIIFTGKPTM